MEFTQVIEKRYSCKNFGERKVEDAKLRAILEAGRLAPTAKNFQEQRIYVVQSAEGLAKIDQATPCRYSAPTCVVAAFDRNNMFTYPGGKRTSGGRHHPLQRGKAGPRGRDLHLELRAGHQPGGAALCVRAVL